MKQMYIKYVLIAITLASLITPGYAQYTGGNGKGDQQLAFSDITLNGTLLADLTSYTGGSGKGDAWIIAEDVNLSGVALSGLVYIGGSGKGDSRATSNDNIPLGNYFLGTTSDFTQASNWSRGVFPSGETAEIRSSAANQPVLSGSQTIVSGTTINILSGASLTISPAGVLTVNGTLNNSGTLTLQSNATGSASIGNSSGAINGDVTIERYIPAVARRWRNYAPPITNFNYTQLIDDIFITGPNGGIGFDPTYHSNNPSLYTYQESTVGGRGWKTVNNINNTLSNGSGVIVFIRGDRNLPSPQWHTPPYVPQNAVNLDVTGTLRFGSVNIPLSYTNTGIADNDGWNLVGNPYASAINWANVTKNNLSPFYYVLNPSTGAYNVANSGKIELGQSFFVQAIGANPSITFNESSKTSTGGIGYFKTANVTFTVKVIQDTITSDLAVLNFEANASTGFQAQEDAIKLPGGNVEVAFVCNNSKLHYNTVPFTSSNITDSFYININSNTTGSFIFQLINSSGLPVNKKYYLTDLWLNQTILFTSDSSFAFNITSNALSKGNRFLLTLQPNTIVPVTLLQFDGKHIPAKGNQLNWITASEKNTSHFTLERKLDSDTAFMPITLVKAIGNTNQISTYQFIDTEIKDVNEPLQYRIKVIDNNSSYTYSKVVTISPEITTINDLVKVYPNPLVIGDMLNITYTDELDTHDIDVKLFDAAGKEIQKFNAAPKRIETEKLAKGIYYLEVKKGYKKQTIKILKP